MAISPVLVASRQFLLEFSPCESCYCSILAPILLKLHILVRNFSQFSCKKFKELYFLSFGQSCLNCISKLPRLRAFQRRTACPNAAKICGSSHLLLVVAGHCLRAGIIESHYFFVLRRILVKFHIRTQLIGSFPLTHRSWS